MGRLEKVFPLLLVCLVHANAFTINTGNDLRTENLSNEESSLRNSSPFQSAAAAAEVPQDDGDSSFAADHNNIRTKREEDIPLLVSVPLTNTGEEEVPLLVETESVLKTSNSNSTYPRPPPPTPTQALDALQRLTSLLQKMIQALSQYQQKFTLRLIRMTERQDIDQMQSIMKDFEISPDKPIFFIAGGLKIKNFTAIRAAVNSETVSSTEASEISAIAEKIEETIAQLQPEVPLEEEKVSVPVALEEAVENSTEILEPDVEVTTIAPQNSTGSEEVDPAGTLLERRKRSYPLIDDIYDVLPIPGRQARTEDPFDDDVDVVGGDFIRPEDPPLEDYPDTPVTHLEFEPGHGSLLDFKRLEDETVLLGESDTVDKSLVKNESLSTPVIIDEGKEVLLQPEVKLEEARPLSSELTEVVVVETPIAVVAAVDPVVVVEEKIVEVIPRLPLQLELLPVPEIPVPIITTPLLLQEEARETSGSDDLLLLPPIVPIAVVVSQDDFLVNVTDPQVPDLLIDNVTDPLDVPVTLLINVTEPQVPALEILKEEELAPIVIKTIEDLPLSPLLPLPLRGNVLSEVDLSPELDLGIKKELLIPEGVAAAAPSLLTSEPKPEELEEPVKRETVVPDLVAITKINSEKEAQVLSQVAPVLNPEPEIVPIAEATAKVPDPDPFDELIHFTGPTPDQAINPERENLFVIPAKEIVKQDDPLFPSHELDVRSPSVAEEIAEAISANKNNITSISEETPKVLSEPLIEVNRKKVIAPLPVLTDVKEAETIKEAVFSPPLPSTLPLETVAETVAAPLPVLTDIKKEEEAVKGEAEPSLPPPPPIPLPLETVKMVADELPESLFAPISAPSSEDQIIPSLPDSGSLDLDSSFGVKPIDTVQSPQLPGFRPSIPARPHPPDYLQYVSQGVDVHGSVYFAPAVSPVVVPSPPVFSGYSPAAVLQRQQQLMNNYFSGLYFRREFF